MPRPLRPALATALTGPLMRGLAAFGSAEMIGRIVRLLTTLVIARQLSPAIVGTAALALSLFELCRVFMNIGAGQRIIAASAAELAATCNSAHRLFWAWSLVVAAVQLLIAAVLALGFGQADAGWMLAALALVYPFMPGGLVQVHLAMREGRNAGIARTAAIQVVADQLRTAALLLAWPSPWAVVLPKLLTAPVWLVLTRRNRPWAPDAAQGLAPLTGLVRFGGGVLLADALAALRTQADNLIIAATLGPVALGSYYFAFNAGLGIVTALAGAFGTVAFPLLCRADDPVRALRGQLLGGLALFATLIAVQALAAPYYVPILFGAHWAFAAPLVAILCVAGIGQLVAVIAANWLRANGASARDALRSLWVCAAALGGLWIGAQSGSITAAATGLVAGTLVASLITLITILRPALASPHQEQPA